LVIEPSETAHCVSLGKQIERRSGLLESSPEQRRRNEEHEDYGHTLPLNLIEATEEEHVSKIENRNGHDEDG
jgi:hypothetical protein